MTLHLEKRQGIERGYMRPCAECDALYEPDKRTSSFCSLTCQRTWNNRRAMRGAQMYDLYMAFRFDRAHARSFRVFSMLNRLASVFRDEDRQTRDGRMSWNTPDSVADRAPHLRTVIMDRGRA